MPVPKVSVIMCTRNRARFLERSYLSVRVQTLDRWELIIADDGSSDETPEVVRKIAASDSRVISLRNDLPRYTIAEASNWAISKATGKYIAVVDDDDAWADPAKLQKQVEFLELNSEYVGCGGGLILVDQNQRETGRVLQPETDAGIRQLALFSSPIANSAGVFRYDAAAAIGFYDISCTQFADWDFWLRMGRVGKLYNFQEYFLYYTRWAGGSSAKNAWKSARIAPSIVQRYRRDYPNFPRALLCAYALKAYSRLPAAIRTSSSSFVARLKRRVSPPVQRYS